MIYLQMFLTFSYIGLFTIGGGSASIPYILNLPDYYAFLTDDRIVDIIAIGQSAPGPGGVNMAMLIGYEAAGFFGGLAAVFGMIFPSLIIVTIIAAFLTGFSEKPMVKHFYYGLKPAVVAAIFVALCRFLYISVYIDGKLSVMAIVLFVVSMSLMCIKKIKQIHPLFLVAFGAVYGIIFL